MARTQGRRGFGQITQLPSKRYRARYTGPDGTVEVPAPVVRAVDTSGAGDVFAGVLAAEWAGGPARALRRAGVAGALATLTAGAGDCAPDGGAIDAALAAVRPER